MAGVSSVGGGSPTSVGGGEPTGGTGGGLDKLQAGLEKMGMSKEDAKALVDQIKEAMAKKSEEAGGKDGGGGPSGSGDAKGKDENQNGIDDIIDKALGGGKLTDADKSKLKEAGVSEAGISALEQMGSGGDTGGDFGGGDTGSGGGAV